ncbi:MAG: tetratricopeptide repeat protein [Nitrospina sp.]|nr:tetratricopeptide repeat protein [Nitrospina sp.]
METTLSSQENHRYLREKAGYFFLKDLCLISAEGSDLFSYLQTQTTNDVNELKPGQGQNNAIVDRKARVISIFSLHRTGEESAVILVETQQKENLLDHLNSFLFREDVTLTLSNHFVLALQGPKSQEIIKNFTRSDDSIPEKPNDICRFTFEGLPALAIAKSLTGEEGCVLVFQTESENPITKKLLEFDQQNLLTHIGPHAQEVFRIESGIPSYGKDINDKNILPETGLDHSSVSYNKGCYIGQEVIARIKTYGAPNFALMGLIIEGDTLPLHDDEIKLNSKKLGVIKSSIFSYSLQKNISLAYIQKDHRSPDIDLDVTIDNKPYKVRTCLLPFYQPQTRKDRSKVLQDKALKLYQSQDDLNQPITLLREAIELDPQNATAYEALGVFLSKQNKLDEAIALMKRLVEINPEEIMAHSNLSVYYMQQGRIEDAEREKGEATALQFDKAIAENMAKKTTADKVKQDLAEREQKISMFKQVLEIDPVDQVANFGLGSVYHDLKRYDEALPPLQTVVKEYKDYSAAYVLLGKTMEKLSRQDEAIQTYREGIAVASKKGDLMPLKEMQQKLNQLLHSNA